MIHTDLNPEHPSVETIMSLLGANTLVVVPRHPQYSAGQCYWNILKHIELNGGALVFGWILIEVPGIFLMAWHHGVWQTAAGELLDLSEHPVTGTLPSSTTFALDPKQEYDLSWPLGMPQVFAPLMNHPDIDLFIQKYQSLHSLQTAKQRELQDVAGAFYDVATALTYGPPLEMQRINEKYNSRIASADHERNEMLPALKLIQRK